ncbi:MAG: hypothetical protein AAF618_05175 [Pseudomonadota bacterium]
MSRFSFRILDRSSKRITALAALIGGLAPLPAAAQEFFTEGFRAANVLRQHCQIGPDTDMQFAEISLGFMDFEEAEGAGDGEMAFAHPDGVFLMWMPANIPDPALPTCEMTVGAELVNEDFFASFTNAAAQSVPNYDLGEPTVTDAGQVWEFESNPDFNGAVWATKLTRAGSGALIIHQRPLIE